MRNPYYENKVQKHSPKQYNREIYTCTMRGMDIFQKPYYREISTMRGRPMRGLPVTSIIGKSNLTLQEKKSKKKL